MLLAELEGLERSPLTHITQMVLAQLGGLELSPLIHITQTLIAQLGSLELQPHNTYCPNATNSTRRFWQDCLPLFILLK